MEHQVVIHVDPWNRLQFSSAEAFRVYVFTQREQGGVNPITKEPLWKKFAHLPLLKVVNDETGEEKSYPDEASLPKQNVETPEGEILIEIPEDEGV